MRRQETVMENNSSGLSLQTPHNPYHAPNRSRLHHGQENNPQGMSNTMVALNSEAVSLYRPSKFGKETRLATRHGFPIPSQNLHFYEIGKQSPSRRGSDKWGTDARHSISSQVSQTNDSI